MVILKKKKIKKVVQKIFKKKKVISKKKTVSKKKVFVKKKVILKKKIVIKKKIVKKVIKKITKKVIKKKIVVSPLKLVRATNNPIISPSHYPNWESVATFNPSAVEHDGKVHIIYRAIGVGDTSALGYALSLDGESIIEKSGMPVFTRVYVKTNKKNKPISYVSGGGWSGGCEDPRLTLINGKVYMLYTAFDGWGSVRIALTSITLRNLILKNWAWKKSVMISPPGEVQKNWVIFPEKINGKYAILHAISPEIMIDYVESLDAFDGKKFIHSLHQDSPLWQLRDRGIRGVGPAPIKTKYGWLVLYHAMEQNDPNRYKLFAMILDEKDPKKVLYRSRESVLAPDEWYENNGHKWGVVYCCGAVVKSGKLFVYYGGADTVACVATAKLDDFLNELIKNISAKFSTQEVKKKK